jgi:hypothetical protein
MHAFAGGFEGRSHDGENIGRFYPGSLGDYFSDDSGLVYDSGNRPEMASLGREPPGLKPYPAQRV